MAETMGNLKRTDYCAHFGLENEGQEVVVCGWAQRTRDLGNLVFIDLRDRTGIIQLAFDDMTDREVFQKAASVRAEFVLCAKGVVRKRESVNHDIPTGMIEVYVHELRILAKSLTPPFEITAETNVKEELRMKHRYLDLRRAPLQNAIMMRHKIAKSARDYFDKQGFLEIETPMLIRSTPEGARDYLVPSRVNKGCFYALPQSPQQYKQLLMLSGFDRYMQIARCFRDEDLRADRQPEFTQIDLEMSFVDENDVMEVVEGFIHHVFKEVLDVDIPLPLPRMPYDEAMNRFGSDKPDTRFGLELVDLASALPNCGFKVFSDALANGGSVRAINAKGLASSLTRKEIDKLTDFVKTYRARGLAFTRITEEATSSSFEKFLTPEEVAAIHAATNAEVGDVILVVADPKEQVVFDSLGALRCHLAEKYKLYDPDAFNFLWVCDFPQFEFSEEENRYVAKHHPFTCPKEEDIPLLDTDKAKVRARAYDIVLNGCEAGGGSIRINDSALQAKMFEALGFTPEEAHARFGYLLDAFQYGVPPHGGLAFGLDRLVMLMLKKDSIKEVIAFPKMQNANELMTECPAPVDEAQLKELCIALDMQE